MKKIIIILAVLFFATNVYAFRCGEYGRNLAREGMHKSEVLMDCGEPAAREVTGVRIKGTRHRPREVSKIEEQTYIIKEYGQKRVYRLKYDEDGVLDDIDYLGVQK